MERNGAARGHAGWLRRKKRERKLASAHAHAHAQKMKRQDTGLPLRAAMPWP